MSIPRASVDFLWWNLNGFSHYEKTRAGEARWPLEPEAYRAKCERIDSALCGMSEQRRPEVFAFAEITSQAAIELRDRLFPDYAVHSLDFRPRAELQVAFLYDQGIGSEPDVIAVPGVPRGTRPVASLDICWPGHRLRLYACHWTAQFSDESRHSRGDIARYLSGVMYEFLGSVPQGESRHVLVVGDLNEEPFGLLEERFHASRDRASARRREHYTDQDLKRVRLYNCAWRWLGESRPHQGVTPAGEVAGTYFWKEKNCWRTLDHVLVNGTLLTDRVPYLDESQLEVVSGPLLLGMQGRPQRFQWNNGKPTGISDHLPIRGRVVLAREESHE